MKRTKQSNNQPIEALLIESFKSTGYLIVNKTLIKQFRLIPAVLLSNYIDKHIYFQEKFPDNDGWFFLTHEQQTEQLGLSDHQIRQGKKELKEKRYIQTKQKGIPAKEWYRINFMNLYRGQALEKFEGKPLKNSRAIKETKLKETINKDNNIIPPSKKPSIKKRNAIYFPLAKHLSDTIVTNKNIEHTTIQLNSWTNDIRQLVENNKVSYQRIQQMLEWYRENIGGQYIPVIESGQSLRIKFTKLEDAMKRQKQFTPSEPDSIIAHGRRWYRNEDGKYRTKTGELLPKE